MPINPAVTDPVLLSHLNAHSVNSSDVTFTEDYAHRGLGKGHSPYAKFYSHSDRKTKYMVSSGLPMIDNSGDPLTPGWSLNGSGVYISQKNLMTATIQGSDVELVVRNADVLGRAAGATLGFTPRVTVGSVVVTPSAPTLLATDPDNSAYNENVLEWNYGTFKRQLRQVQGRVHGKWIFPANPGGDVRITYNQTGDYRLKLGEYAANGDEEFIPESVFLDAEALQIATAANSNLAPMPAYPITVGDSATFYPDAHTETSSYDGFHQVTGGTGTYYVGNAGVSWTAIHGSTGAHYYDWAFDDYSYLRVNVRSGTTTDYWNIIERGTIALDTSGLGAGAAVTGGTLSICRQTSYGITHMSLFDSYGNYTGYISPGMSVVSASSSTAGHAAINRGDYDAYGTTLLAPSKAFPNVVAGSSGTYTNFALNAAGIAHIDPAGYSDFGLREASEVVGPPTWPGYASNQNFGYTIHPAEAGATTKPKLVVEYTLPATGKGFFGMM